MGFLEDMSASLLDADVDQDQVRVLHRVAEVQNMWSQLVEEAILEHTNAVYIFNKDGVRQMHVYVDDSIYAAELNNRRELLIMRCNQQFNEHIDQFLIHISKGKRKTTHPFKIMSTPPTPTKTLTPADLDYINKVCENIENPRVQAAFRNAMISDLQRNKAKS